MKVGLRIDVDTYRGTRQGVPRLCDRLAKHGVCATFFFSVGPDNMGRHIWRLLRPAFLMKMLRSKAGSLYGWDILLRGTFWPGPNIGEKCADVIRATANAGHEVGLHAWDHHAWQARLDTMDGVAIRRNLTRCTESLTRIMDRPPTCSAAPSWKCNDTVLREQLAHPFAFNSDCRGSSVFLPVVDGHALPRPQVPVTLPTYDEVIGRNGVSDANYNEFLFARLRPDSLNVLTIHAEVEGLARETLFEEFIRLCAAKNVVFVPLGNLVTDGPPPVQAPMVRGSVPGRDGWVACQGAA